MMIPCTAISFFLKKALATYLTKIIIITDKGVSFLSFFPPTLTLPNKLKGSMSGACHDFPLQCCAVEYSGAVHNFVCGKLGNRGKSKPPQPLLQAYYYGYGPPDWHIFVLGSQKHICGN